MLREGIKVHAEDVEPKQFVLLHLGNCGRDTPSYSNESSLHEERKAVNVHLNPPSDETLALCFTDQEISIDNPIGIGG
ncbi:hypothetical protein KI387_033278, partial [Taxus chinensis]